MFPPETRPLQVVAVGDDELEDTLAGSERGVGRRLEAETVGPEAVGSGSPPEQRADCVVVDGAALGDGCVDVVEECTGSQSALPVVVLSGGDPQVVADALAAGAAGTLPRQVVETGPQVVVEHLASIVERDPAPDGFQEVFENVSDGLVIHDPETGEIRDVNDRYCELTGYNREELVGETLWRIVHEGPDDSYENALAWIERAREEGPQLFEFEGRRRSGESFVGEVHLRVVRLRGEEQVLADVRDVTERTERERMVETLHDATEQLQNAESLDDARRAAVGAVRDVLGLPVTACWHHRETDGGPRLELVAGTEPVHECDPGTFRPGETEYEVYREGETLVSEPSGRVSAEPLDAVIMLPLGEHGLLVAGSPGVGEYDKLVVDAARTLAGHVQTALDRVARAETLRESERRLGAILDRIDEAIFLAPAREINDSDPATDYVSAGYEDVYGLSLEEMHETYDEGFFGMLHPDEYDEYWALVHRIHRDVESGEPADRYSREYRIGLPDGESRWIHSDFYPIRWDDGRWKMAVVSREITERKQRERTLESFHDATAELTTADTVDAVGAVAVRAAAEVFELPVTAVYSYDEQTGNLDPAARGPGVETPLPVLTAENDSAWTAFVEEQMRRVGVENAPALDAGPSDEALLVPLGGNGLLVVWAEQGPDPDAANILAATVEAALNRLRGERRLESRSEELEAQVQRTRRLEAVTELTRCVEAAITAESTRRGIQEAVCEELTGVGPFGAAWVAEADVGTDRLTPRTAAGVGRDRAEAALDAGGADTDSNPHPAYEAWRTGEPAVVEGLVGGRRSGWRRALLGRGAGSVCAVPLVYSGVTHGVLTIVADEPDAFGDRELEVLDQLGTSIGHAIAAVERKRALESDDTLELEFEGDDTELPPARLARELGCRVRHERTVRRQNGSVSVYYTLAGDLPGDVATAATEALPGAVERVTRVDGETVIERRGSSWFGAVVSEYEESCAAGRRRRRARR